MAWRYSSTPTADQVNQPITDIAKIDVTIIALVIHHWHQAWITLASRYVRYPENATPTPAITINSIVGSMRSNQRGCSPTRATTNMETNPATPYNATGNPRNPSTHSSERFHTRQSSMPVHQTVLTSIAKGRPPQRTQSETTPLRPCDVSILLPSRSCNQRPQAVIRDHSNGPKPPHIECRRRMHAGRGYLIACSKNPIAVATRLHAFVVAIYVHSSITCVLAKQANRASGGWPFGDR